MPACFIYTGHFSVGFAQGDIFHQVCSGHPVDIDIRKPIDQQYAPQLFSAAAQHFHRHCPFSAHTVGVLPFQQSAIVAAVSIAGDSCHTQRAANLDIADLSVTI